MFRGIKRQIGTLGTMAIGLVAVVLGCLPAASSFAQIPCRYEITAIIEGPYCGQFGSPTTPTGISPSGRYVCGFYATCGLGATRAWVYDVETTQMTTLPLPPGVTESAADDVNDAGLVAGGMNGGPFKTGFVYDLTTGQYIAQIPAAITNGYCELTAINSAGKVCGIRSISLSPPFQTAFTWSASEGVIDLGLINGKNTAAIDLNDAGTVAGTLLIGTVQHAMLWKKGAVTDLGSPTKFNSGPNAINGAEVVAGGWTVQQDPLWSHPANWSNGATFDLGVPVGFVSASALDISASGVCVGRCKGANPADPWLGAIWSAGQVALLDDLIDTDQLTYLSISRGVSDTGRLVAESHLVSNFNLVAVVLTPSSFEPTDLDANCRVNMDDLLLVINEWGKTKSIADINHDGIVNSVDLIEVISNWTL